MSKKKKERAKRAEELFSVVSNILSENDHMANEGPWLPGKWRAPLVQAANRYHAVRKGVKK